MATKIFAFENIFAPRPLNYLTGSFERTDGPGEQQFIPCFTEQILMIANQFITLMVVVLLDKAEDR